MEMGRRDMRRGEGTNRFPKKKSGSGVSAKQKKAKLKKLSLADDDDVKKLNHKKKEMMMMCYDFPSSDLENEEVSLKKKKKKSSKLLKKNLKESSNGGVHPHASVPRKLRSAMKKRRNLESVSNLSSPSKRLNQSITGIESLNMDLVKKDNQETDAKDVVSESMMISKDEEEVAETLFGLADMFTTEVGSVDNKTCDSLLSDDDKETTKDDSVLLVQNDFTNKEESLEPAVPVLSSDKTKQLDEMPLQQDHSQRSSSVNVTDAHARAIDTKAATSGFDYKSNGDLALWPGLSSTVQSSSHVLSKPSSTNLPPWMAQAVSPTKNASLLSVRPRKLKKCVSHIYICQLIKALQTRESNQTEQISSDMPQCRLPDPVTTVSDFPSKMFQNPHLIDLHKTHNTRPAQEDKTQLSLELHGPHTTQKQSYDFLSLSSNGSAQSHLPLQNSFPQFPISAAYNSHLSPAISSHHQMQQMSPYLASRYQTAYNANHQQQQQQQLQKRIWAAQYNRPVTSGNTMPPLSNQYSKPNLSLNLASIQPLQVASSTRYNNNVSQQQHRLMSAAAAMSMSHHHNNNRSRTVTNRQEHHFPFVYEDTRTPLQLLCNEQYG